MKLIIFASVVLAITGCSAANWYPGVTSGAIGCQPDDIKISDKGTSTWAVTTWKAECKSKKYVCSFTAGNTNCTEAK